MCRRDRALVAMPTTGLDLLQVWRAAIGRVTGSLPAANPEANYRKTLSQSLRPCSKGHMTIFHMDVAWARHLMRCCGGAFPGDHREGTPGTNTITLSFPRLLALNL